MTPAARSRLTRDNLGFLLAKASQRWNELLYKQLSRRGYAAVRPSYGSILIPLYEEDGLQMSELARRARLSKQTMTTMIRLMEKRGLVRRRHDPADRRATLVYLTPAARRLEASAEHAVAQLERSALTAVPPGAAPRIKAWLKTMMDLAR
jgi:MarR family transcriptional regulator for hemolysin